MIEILEELNQAILNLYDLSIANAPISAGECRDIADKVADRIGNARRKLSDGPQEILNHIEFIDTIKLAANGFAKEATAISGARVTCDRLIREAINEDSSVLPNER